ncbi:TetR/AcrR family transcriptional regulator [Cognatishimia activa]|uniref:TetR/AcrR family transcriptional regulator n=1 Tax=Cognatishimia activa TaxID=1715691 RepID=UPI002231FC0F|nr:TetR/AcrR family transcriptional regulator [Cognatishimia activa]UZD90549.1 TetR/AcrR family transcriptional regulator [Cognatishimia activa]
MTRSDTANRILNVAEKAARAGGYGAFSFREIAAEIGIKSASVHYHFPTKEALGEALAARYTDRFLSALGDPHSGSRHENLQSYIQNYAKALKDDGLMCLCGMFGAEIQKLPESVARQTQDFFKRNLVWLESVYMAAGANEIEARQNAASLISCLEGAMILARAMEDSDLFDQATAHLG